MVVGDTIAAIALPGLMRSKDTSKEGTALGAVRTITSSEVSYPNSAQEVDEDGVGLYGALANLSEPPEGVLASWSAASRTGRSMDTNLKLRPDRMSWVNPPTPWVKWQR
ncbi:MAG: hypothetical protein QGG73_02440 [Candidatus Hydrogenedentes bacterium]|jgi:hypothetical protein|nr:hypothetical protein [Candidatus Hydrogenedentota bacterium]